MTQTSPSPFIAPPDCLALRALSLSHFRNHSALRLDVEAGSVALIGPNGAGKTNILEAISMLAPGRGLRRAALADMDELGAGLPWAVAAEITGRGGVPLALGTARDPLAPGGSDKRLVKIGGKAARSQSELAQHVSALWVTPPMDTLFMEGMSARRKFFDRLVYSFDAEHAVRVHAYEHSMRERGRLLQQGGYDERWVSALERRMSEAAIAVALARHDMLERLHQAIFTRAGPFPQAEVTLSGAVETLLQEEPSALAAEEGLLARLKEARAHDALTGRCRVGIHRSDIFVTHTGKAMRAEQCSMGEQKALLLSILLAHASAGSAWRGITPLLLLDEVVTHLDREKRAALFAEITRLGAQAWLTGTDEDAFESCIAQRYHLQP